MAQEDLLTIIENEHYLDHENAEELRNWLKEKEELRIVAMGKTGVGKSTLLNGFVGVKVFDEGDEFDPVTLKVQQHQIEAKGIKITCWDSPGLQDGSGNEDTYLQDLQKMTKGDIDLMLYCINMLESRSDLHAPESAVRKLTEALGKDVWKNTLFVLTFANMYERRLTKKRSKDLNREFNEKVQEWKLKIQDALRTIQIEESIIDKVQVSPAGFNANPSLPGRQYWLSELWSDMLDKLREDAKPLALLLNSQRFRMPDEITDEDLKKEAQDQPIIITPGVKAALASCSVGGIATGAGIGAAIGGITIGAATLGIGAGAGAAIGAVTGGAIGVAAGALVALFVAHKEKKARRKYVCAPTPKAQVKSGTKKCVIQ